MTGYIMAFMITIGIACAFLFSRAENVSIALLSAPEETVKLILSIGGLLCFWSGIMAVAEKCGILKGISRLLRPILSPLFGEIGDRAFTAVVMNITANFLGLGNAATPFGIIAMRELLKEQNGERSAGRAMIIFVIFNTVGFQFIPTTVGALRKAAGSEAPFSILLPVFIVSFLSLMSALIPALILNKRVKK